MPIWLRNFTFKKMSKYYKEEQEAQSGKNPNTTNNLDKAREILQKAHKQNPKNKPSKDNNPTPQPKTPDFVSKSSKYPSQSKLSRKS
jgi:hypothetical protein